MYDKTATTFIVRHYSENGYKFTEIAIRQQYQNSVAEQLEGAVDNKTGYSSRTIAAQMEEKFRKLLAAGHEHTYDSLSVGGLEVTIVWQHYDNGSGELEYCDPRYSELGRGLADIEKGLAFIKKMGGVIERQRAKQTGGDRRKVSNHSFERPERVLAALRSMKDVVETQYFRNPDEFVGVVSVKVLAPALSEAA